MHPLSEELKLLSIKIIMKLLRKYWIYLYISTRCKYSKYFKQWHDFIGVNSKTNIKHVLNFLTIFEKGNSYRANFQWKFALTTIMTVALFQPLNDHLLIIIVITGVYNRKPSLPKLGFVLDVGVKLDILRIMVPVYFAQ